MIDSIERILDLIEALPVDHPKVIKADEFLRRISAATEEYSSMVRAYLTGRRASVLLPP